MRKHGQMKGIYPAYPADPVSTIRELFLRTTRRFPDKIALQSRKAGKWVPLTYREFRNEVEWVAAGLAALGLEPSSGRLAIIGDNRPEWAVAYLAGACTGIVCVPIDRDLKQTEIRNILLLSGAGAVICDDKHLEMLQTVRPALPDLHSIVTMDEAGREGVIPFSELKLRGRERIAAGTDDFEARSVGSDSLLSILFTSGTMGNPKGVMLSHGNVAGNIVDAAKWVNLRTEDRFLSVLPVHHSYECTDGFLLPVYLGATISYAENLRRFADNLAETHSTAVLGVPLLWHSFYAKIEAAMAEKGMWKVNAAKKVASFSEKLFGLNIRRLVFGAVHRKLGGSLRVLISGGAAIDPAVARGFRELGISLLQGYGLTESAPIIAVNRDDAFKDDAAGLPLPSVEVRIAEDGEILARGPNIMLGYYNNPDATREALDDGWLHTGDLGYIDQEGFLYIQGRKKSVIVTAAGKKIYPEEVEAAIMKSPWISECLVWGTAESDPRKEVSVEAIVVPDAEFCAQKRLGRSEIENLVRQEVKERCRELASFKRVARLTVRFDELEKTTTRKVKRYLYTTRAASDVKDGERYT